MIYFIIVYCIVLLLYFYTETSGKMYLRAPNKIVLASLFLVYGFVQFFINPDKFSPSSFHVILLVALVLSWLGDVFLLFDFGRGGDFFLAGNICFVAYEISLLTSKNVVFAQYWWVLIVAVVLLGGYAFLTLKCKKFDAGKMKIPLIMYMTSVILNGCFGIALIVYLASASFLLFGIGALLFMISDFLLMTHKFLCHNKWILRANSATYFVGLLLIVLSMGL